MRIWICSPHKDLVHPAHYESRREQEAICSRYGVEFVIVPDLESRGTFITWARNRGCVHALAHKCDAILMWDDDMAIHDPEGVMHMVEALSDGKPVVSAFCRSRHNTGIITHGQGQRFRFDGQLHGEALRKDAISSPGLYEIGHTGTGILLISAEVLWELRRVWRAMWRSWLAGDGPYPSWHNPWFELWPATRALFPGGPGKETAILGDLPNEEGEIGFLDFLNNYSTLDIVHSLQPYLIDNNEDCVFSVKCRHIGAEMWLDTRITTSHFGERDFTTKDYLVGGKDHPGLMRQYDALERSESERLKAIEGDEA